MTPAGVCRSWHISPARMGCQIARLSCSPPRRVRIERGLTLGVRVGVASGIPPLVKKQMSCTARDIANVGVRVLGDSRRRAFHWS